MAESECLTSNFVLQELLDWEHQLQCLLEDYPDLFDEKEKPEILPEEMQPYDGGLS